MAKAPKKLLIIDGNALVHRSFHALPITMRTKAGEITNAVYGFTSVLMKALKEFRPAYIVVTFDRKEKTFRHEAYAGYKATRAKAPDELYAQFPRIKEVVTAFNIPIFEKAGFEADDLIGTIAAQVQTGGERIESIIVTGDMDTLQLINDATKVYKVTGGTADTQLYDTDSVRQRFGGLTPAQMTDYKALRGDPSDNIPGVPGIGEKGAIELIKTFGSLEKLYQQLTAKKTAALVKPRIIALLQQYKKEAFFSKQLATIDCRAPIDFQLAEAKTSDFNIHDVTRLFGELEFSSLAARLPEVVKTLQPVNKTADDEQRKFAAVQQHCKYTLVTTEVAFKKFLTQLKKQKIFCFDTETANFNPLAAVLLGISFCWKKNEAYYIQVKGKRPKVKGQDSLFGKDTSDDKNSGIPVDTVIKELKSIFENEKIKKIAHNIKFDVEAMESQGPPSPRSLRGEGEASIKVNGIYFDTMLAGYLLEPGTRQHGLDAASLRYLNYQKISKDDLLGSGRNKIAFAQAPVDRLALYSCEDADCTFQLYAVLDKELAQNKLNKLFFDMEMPLVRVLVDMERAGIMLDTKYLATLQKEVAKKLQKLTTDIHALAGKPFNINSTQQLQDVLFETLRIPTHLVKRTKTGYSTAADELYKLKGQHPIIDLLTDYRELNKLQSTYIEALPKLVDARDRRLHTNYNQTIAATGRLSSTEPNLQNIPIRTEAGKKIRRAFIARPGYRLVAADYSQIELRLAAAMSGDAVMVKAFNNSEDIHSATAAAINDIPLADVTPAMRREAKATNFGIIYGQGAFGLAQTADIAQWQAKEFIDKYFQTYAGVKRWLDNQIAQAQTTGRAETLFGRIRRIPDINANNAQIRKAAERVAVNTPLQGSAADIMKAAMIRAHHALAKFGADATILLQVHDELVVEVKNNLVDTVASIVKTAMENVIKLSVPVVVDVSVGDNWEEIEPLSL